MCAKAESQQTKKAEPAVTLPSIKIHVVVELAYPDSDLSFITPKTCNKFPASAFEAQNIVSLKSFVSFVSPPKPGLLHDINSVFTISWQSGAYLVGQTAPVCLKEANAPYSVFEHQGYSPATVPAVGISFQADGNVLIFMTIERIFVQV